jgi:hypothetical protein
MGERIWFWDWQWKWGRWEWGVPAWMNQTKAWHQEEREFFWDDYGGEG